MTFIESPKNLKNQRKRIKKVRQFIKNVAKYKFSAIFNLILKHFLYFLAFFLILSLYKTRQIILIPFFSYNSHFNSNNFYCYVWFLLKNFLFLNLFHFNSYFFYCLPIIIIFFRFFSTFTHNSLRFILFF